MVKANKLKVLILGIIFIGGLYIQPAFAQGYARPWQMDFQEAASTSMEKFIHLHHFLLAIITLTSLFVLGLLAYTCVRFSKKNNPVPSSTSHNTLLEIIWSVVPVLILVAIAVPSIKILYYVDNVKDPELTVKVVGHQWYWEYIYPDNGDISFDSNIIKDEELKPGQLRLLEVDNHVVLPVDTNIRIMLTAADVIHAWAVPAFGVKKDAVPGKLNETWVRITKPGTYYGQCSELCGVGHGYMPIVVDAVSKEDFKKWVDSKSKKTAATPTPTTPPNNKQTTTN